MKILKFKQFKINESIKNKKLILLSGPSASGKSYLATKKLKAKHWYEKNSPVELIGTDNFMNDKKIRSKFKKLLKDFGCPELAKFDQDWHWLIELYKDDYKKWKDSASEEEKEKYEELKSKLPYEKSQTENFPNNKKDGRICGMAWCAYLLPDSVDKIIFDDVSVGIKSYFDVEDILLFTPLDWIIKNIESRVEDGGEGHIDVNKEGTALYQYCEWFMATDKPDLDNKAYSEKIINQLLNKVGHKKPEEILNKLGVTDKLKNEFYLTTRPKVNPNVIVNTRDKSTGRAIDIDNLKE
jgi:hypothetical protein